MAYLFPGGRITRSAQPVSAHEFSVSQIQAGSNISPLIALMSAEKSSREFRESTPEIRFGPFALIRG
jgi:hypothetical protein